jgi:hypothetical protein
MKNKILIGSLSFLTLFFIILWWYKPCKPCVCSCCITFDSAPFSAGMIYNLPNFPPASPLVTACDFDVSIREFQFPNRSPVYGEGRVETAPAGFGSGNVFMTNNVTLEFKSRITSNSTVTIDYLNKDINGTINLTVNGTQFIGKLIDAPAFLNPLLGGGASVSITTVPVAGTSAETGVITLTGGIWNFNIGGKEFFVDNICRK